MSVNKYHLPTTLIVDGAEYAINADFRAILHIFEMFEDDELTDREKSLCLLKMLYCSDIPYNTDEALRQAIWFINGGIEEQARRGRDYGRLYSWEQDGLYIFSAVDGVLGYSCRSREFLHWWDFLGAFLGIGECTFSTIIHLRKQKKKGKLSKEERQMWNDSIDIFELRIKEDEELADNLMAMIIGTDL